MVHQSLVLANDIAIHGNDVARLGRQIAAKELTEFALTDKADTGRVFFLRGDQIQLFSDFTHFRFFQLANREQALGNLFVAEGIKEVTLIFVAVEAAQQLAFAVDISAAHVVAGSDVVSAQIFSGEFEEGFKFDLFVAQNIRVWRAAGLVFSQEMLEHVIPVLCGKVDGVQFNAELVADRLRIGQIFRRGTVFLAIVLFPVLHEQAFNLIALLQQEPG